MATQNDYKLLEKKCISMFDAVSSQLQLNEESVSVLGDEEKARFGFYYIVIQCLTSLEEVEEITQIICDQDFNVKLFNNPGGDEGIDAFYIDEQNHTISIFNFKYRKYNEDRQQSINEFVASSKFFSAIKINNLEHLQGKIKENAEELIKKLNGTEEWDVIFYYVSNESKAIDASVGNVKTISDEYGFEFKGLALDEMVSLLSLHPQNINAKFLVSQDSVLTYEENSISSEKSFVIRMNLAELIRITCNDERIRETFNCENLQELSQVDVDMNVLYDNVRGLITRSKFNNSILKSLEDEPTKIFYYNNGLTVVAENITTSPINMGNKWKFEVANFQVINGGQTLRTIHNFNLQGDDNLLKLNEAQVLVRFLKVSDEELKNKIAEYTNSQNAISVSDLKSLRKEQIQLEEYLGVSNIRYLRKRGDFRTDKSYDYTIGKERFGQILLSTKFERPEYASNKKRDIFDNYYDRLFSDNRDLISDESVRLVNMYKDSEMAYKRTEFLAKVQKNLYICYISYKTGRTDYDEIVKEFESCYSENDSIRISTTAFREKVDDKFNIINNANSI